jgi:hypothetical protein
LKGIQSSKDKKSLQFIDEEHMEERSNEESEVHGKTQTIGIDHIVVSNEIPVNMIN